MPTNTTIDLSTIDFNQLVEDRNSIQQWIPHRGHMLHLDGVAHVDREKHILVGFKDVHADEFWAAGHFPNYPLLPGVIQCEAAAQLLAYYASVTRVFGGALAGLGGLENARFRGSVRPGDRLVIVCTAIRIDRRMTKFHAEGYVNQTLVFECDVMGVPIPGADMISKPKPETVSSN